MHIASANRFVLITVIVRYHINIFDGLRVNIAKSPSVSMKYNLSSNICIFHLVTSLNHDVNH